MISLDNLPGGFLLMPTLFGRKYNDDKDRFKIPIGPPKGGFFLPTMSHD